MSPGRLQTTTGSGRLLAALGALRHRNYRLYWFGQLFSVLAQNMEAVAQGWLVLEMTDSPLILGLTGLTFSIPTIALTLLGGAVADRADRKRIMILSQVAAVMMFSVLALLVMTERVALLHVMAFSFFSGCVRAFDRPSRMALLPQMVPKQDIANAVAIGGTIWQLNKLVGPAVAGILIYLFGIGPTYLFCLAASATAIVLWLGIRLDGQRITASAGGLVQNMIEGLDFIRKNEIYYTFIGMTFFNSIFGMSYLILMPVFARDILSVGSEGFGFLQSAGGAGALCGVLLAAYLGHGRGKGKHAISGALVFGAMLIVFAFSNSYSLSLVLACLLGIASQFYMTTIHTILQLNLPDQLRGRVMSIHGLAWELMPVGGMIAGVIAEVSSAPSAVALGGAMVGGMALVVAICLPRIRRLEQ
jgi:MFS family permease